MVPAGFSRSSLKGASSASISIQEKLDGKPVDWMEQVSDKQYQAGLAPDEMSCHECPRFFSAACARGETCRKSIRMVPNMLTHYSGSNGTEASMKWTSFQGVADRQVLYLTTIGRRTGLPREIEIWFVVWCEHFYLFAETGEAA